jgi:hypothetical protein
LNKEGKVHGFLFKLRQSHIEKMEGGWFGKTTFCDGNICGKGDGKDTVDGKLGRWKR